MQKYIKYPTLYRRAVSGRRRVVLGCCRVALVCRCVVSVCRCAVPGRRRVVFTRCCAGSVSPAASAVVGESRCAFSECVVSVPGAGQVSLRGRLRDLRRAEAYGFGIYFLSLQKSFSYEIQVRTAAARRTGHRAGRGMRLFLSRMGDAHRADVQRYFRTVPLVRHSAADPRSGGAGHRRSGEDRRVAAGRYGGAGLCLHAFFGLRNLFGGARGLSRAARRLAGCAARRCGRGAHALFHGSDAAAVRRHVGAGAGLCARTGHGLYP